MAKFLQRMGTKKEKFLIIMKIISVEIPVTEPVQKMSIEWKRGDKQSVTKNTFDLSPDKPLALVNETFSKNSIFYHIIKQGKYFKKVANIRVKGFLGESQKEKILGELDLDISQFVGVQNESKSLQLNKALPNSVINLQISIQPDDGQGKNKNVNQDSSSEECDDSINGKTSRKQSQANGKLYQLEEQKNGSKPTTSHFDNLPNEKDAQIEILMQENDQMRDQLKNLEYEIDQFKSSIESKDRQYETLKNLMEEQQKQFQLANNQGNTEADNEIYAQMQKYSNKVLTQDQEIQDLRKQVEDLTKVNGQLKETQEQSTELLTLQRELESQKKRTTLKEQTGEMIRKKLESMAEELDQKDNKIFELIEMVEQLKRDLESAKNDQYEFDRFT